MVVATVELTISICLTSYTAVVAVACCGDTCIVMQILEIGEIGITYNTAGVAAARYRATHREVVYLGFLVGGGAYTKHHTEQTAVACSTGYPRIVMM